MISQKELLVIRAIENPVQGGFSRREPDPRERLEITPKGGF